MAHSQERVMCNRRDALATLLATMMSLPEVVERFPLAAQ